MRRTARLCAAFVSFWPLVAAAGQSVTLAWNANTETNLAGYRLYHGTAPRSYAATTTVQHPTTNATVRELQPGVTYYFAVTAFTTDGLESDYSDEVSYRVPAVPPAAPTWGTNRTVLLFLEGACDLAGPWDTITNLIWAAPVEAAVFYRARLELR